MWTTIRWSAGRCAPPRRYTDEEVAATMGDADCLTLQVRVADIFGDNGIISAVICRRFGADWEIDSWLMSCRVLGRRVENAVLAQVAAQVRARGGARLIGAYCPTGRNGIVRDLYRDLGFVLAGEGEDGSQRWVLELAQMPTISGFHGECISARAAMAA